MKFKKGDRVIVLECVSADILGRKLDGKVGTVLEYHKDSCEFNVDNLLGVEFDENVDGHCCDGKGEWGHCWWMFESQCELIDTTPFEDRQDDINYYTGEVVCVEDGMKLIGVGRPFRFIDGDAKYKGVSITKTPITSVDDLNSRFKHIRFIEVIE